ncbi:D-alanyl-D-alanine carboxypeptidase [Bacillus sp. S3]|uniref:D-alanyl-D-alanine carboxypeptidase family protein n=1 Tax=Bacillus sp. S3 TaxID=486398 RepID=UPI00118C76A3|nr:D-alanyl-D-alanine carboxypeptidase family protein [Bacillus sp. S3]QCJ43093.1 D-alanyl-D-alanine carboxypeptidase [Bacillus sp. S3]
MKKNISVIIIVLFFLTYQMNIFAQGIEQLDLKSESAVLLDSDTGAVLYEKNANEKMYPASVTKIATAIYAIEKGNLDGMATVSANAVRQDGTRVYLVEGEQMPLKQLIQGMLINSGNDAAVAIAEYLDGSVEKFAENLNSYLQTKIGVNDTHFTNPSGLFDENHYTTAMDLALITNYAIKNPVFAEIFGTKVLGWKGQSWETTLLTHHRMLKGELPYPEVTGGKTGYTSQTKQTLATTADNGKIRLTAVVLKSDLKNDKYQDTALLFDYGFKGYQHAVLKQGEIYKSEDKEFYPEQDTVITENVEGCVKKINPDGVLSIEDQNGKVIHTIQLKYKELPMPKVAPVKTKKAREENNQQLIQVNALVGMAIIAFAAAVIGFGRKKTKASKNA